MVTTSQQPALSPATYQNKPVVARHHVEMPLFDVDDALKRADIHLQQHDLASHGMDRHMFGEQRIKRRRPRPGAQDGRTGMEIAHARFHAEHPLAVSH